ncbi:preprotein translocase subunit Tim44 [Glycomyces fuscus]|nr:preprotein translocase subunit Tim44 [Glycomyces fuscus]
MSDDPYRIDAPTAGAPSPSSAPPSASPASRPRRTPARRALLVLLGVVLTGCAAANGTLSLLGHELVGSVFGATALASLVALVVLVRRGDR